MQRGCTHLLFPIYAATRRHLDGEELLAGHANTSTLGFVEVAVEELKDVCLLFCRELYTYSQLSLFNTD